MNDKVGVFKVLKGGIYNLEIVATFTIHAFSPPSVFGGLAVHTIERGYAADSSVT